MEIKMIITALRQRHDHMNHLSQKLSGFRISDEVRGDLIILSFQAMDLNQSLIRISSIGTDLRNEIYNYLQKCEEIVFKASCELPTEFCEIEECLLELKTGRLLFMYLIENADED